MIAKKTARARTVPCNFCLKSFQSNYCLKIHMIVHTGERPFQCHICDRAFKKKITGKTCY